MEYRDNSKEQLTTAWVHETQPSRASRTNLRAFELGSLILWIVTAVLISTVYHNQSDYWFLLLSWTFMFPISGIADEYGLVLRYDPGFLRLVWRIPIMIPFAFGWFFTLPLILIWNSSAIQGFALYEQAIFLFVALLVWSFFIEWLGVVQNLWIYHWSPKGWRWRGVPVVIPFIDAITYVLVFVLHEVAVPITMNMKWVASFAVSYLIYAAGFAALAFLNWLVIRRGFRVKPTLA